MRMKRRKKLISLRKQIIGITFWFCVIIAVVWFIGLAASIRSFQNEQDEKRMKALSEYAGVLDNSIIQLNDVAGNIFQTNAAFIGLNQYKNVAEKVDYIHSLLNLLKIQVNSNKNLSGLFVYYDNMENVLYYLNENMNFQTKEVLKKAGISAGASGTMGGINYGSTMYVQSAEDTVYYNVFYKKTKAAISGCVSLKAGLPIELEDTATYGVMYEGVFYRTGGNAIELYPNELTTLQQGKNWLETQVVYVQQLGTTNMAVVEILPLTPWLHINYVHILLVLLFFIFIGLAVKVNRLVALEMTKPLEDMNHALSEIQAGEWKVHFNSKNRVEEIENVHNAVKVMLKEIEQYKIRSYEEQLEKQETELQYLRLQLAPHFYTNCLKNAYYMLMLKEYENVEKFLLCLTTHLRYLLQKNVKMVTVRTEREFVENYINLQKLMTEKDLSCEMLIDEEALDMEIPILMLQTFVENSIKYGRETEQEDLRILIRIRFKKMEESDYLDINISDNGQGYPDDVLAELNQNDISQEQKFGVGVINLQHRMRIQYGLKAEWYFSNAGGACSELIVPADGGINERITGR